MTLQRLLAGAFALTVSGGLLSSAAAQRDTVHQAASADSTSDTTSAQPMSVAAAEAMGIKLIGVFDASTGEWLGSATVRDTLGHETVTSPGGIAALNELTPVLGKFMLEIHKAGYAPQHVKLQADTAAEFLVSLTPSPLGQATALPTMVTTDRRRMLLEDAGLRAGFVGRCQLNVVECVGRKDLDLRSTENLAQLLTNTLGVHRACTVVRHPEFSRRPQPDLTDCVIQMRPTAGPPRWCTPSWFLNGMEWAPLAGQSQAQLDQFLTAANIDGIEVYLSGMPRPARFNEPDTPCGAIVIWSH